VVRGSRVVGLRQIDGMPHQSQRARSSGSSKAHYGLRPAAGRAKRWGTYRARLAVNSRTQLDSTGHNEDRPTSLPVLARNHAHSVAGQEFEPWKASADGFTDRCGGPPGGRRTFNTPSPPSAQSTRPWTRSALGPSVGRPSRRNNARQRATTRDNARQRATTRDNARQRATTLTNDKYCRWSASVPRL
jgi:hypothetical protein